MKVANFTKMIHRYLLGKLFCRLMNDFQLHLTGIVSVFRTQLILVDGSILGGLVDIVVPRWEKQSWWWTSFRALVVSAVKVLLIFSRIYCGVVVLTSDVFGTVHFVVIFRALADWWSFRRVSMSRTTGNARNMFIFTIKECKRFLRHKHRYVISGTRNMTSSI